MSSFDPLTEKPSVVRRIACMLYEALLVLGVVFISGLMFGMLTQTRNAMAHRLELQIYLFIVIGVYFAWFWSKGQTLAMKTWHLHIRMADGSPLTLSRALARYLMAWLWVLPPLTLSSLLQLNLQETLAWTVAWGVLWSVPGRLRLDRQFLHETWSGTELVYIKPSHTTREK